MNRAFSKEQIEAWWLVQDPSQGMGEHAARMLAPEGVGLDIPFGTPEYFASVDNTLFSWHHPLHDKTGYFGRVFPYAQYRGKRVLEVGCGMGTLSMLWANAGARLCAVDSNPSAVEATAARFRLLGRQQQLSEAGANNLPFAGESFDYVYSWAGLHHAPNLERSVSELFRVLRPGGAFSVMLYNRDSWFYRYRIQYLEGFLHGESQFLNPLQLASRYTGGGRQEGNTHTWPVAKEEMQPLFGRHSADVSVQIVGADLDRELDVPFPGLTRYIPTSLRKPWARRLGWNLWVHGTKR